MPRPGSRTQRFKEGYGRLSNNRIAWLRTVITHQLAISAYDPDALLDDESPDYQKNMVKGEKGLNYLLHITIPGRRVPVTWNISAMTTEELEASREFFNYLFDLADPIVRERDKVAKDAFAEGDDAYTRSYRQLPQLVIRTRKEPSDSEGVHDGPSDAPSGNGD